MENESQELLDGVTISDVSGSQYMIQPIPRMDSQQLLSSELLQHHTGLVVDLGAGDFIPVTYGSEELLPQDLTEEDRNLAAALVAVQLSQQQKHHLPTEGNVMINGIQPLCSDLHIVDSENIYKQNLIPKLCFDSRDFTPGDVYDRNEEILSIKSEKEIELAASDGEHKSDSRTLKKSLPHKKRISRKLRKNSSSIRKIYKCSLCEQVFNNNEEITTHQSLCQTTITPINQALFTCQLCSANYQDQLRFFEHLKEHYEPNILVEQTMTVVEKPKNQYKQHTPIKQQENIMSTIINTCLECNKTFRRQKTFEAHVREFHSKDVLQEFSEPEDLMSDIDVNSSVQPVVVDTKEWYHREDELQATEEDLRELEAQDYVCHICKRQFAMRAELHEHSLTCKEIDTIEVKTEKKSKKKVVEFKCTECPRVFNHKNSLVYHMRGHTGVRPHTCDQCGKSFFAASALKVHQRLHSGDKPYCCEYCGKYFRQWGDLKYHCVSIHSDHKQYQCDFCGKDFARKYSLIVHRRIHTGEKNYKCEFCSKTFRASSYLQNHRRIHTGEKPHCCDTCGKRFRVRSDMKRHMLTHNRKRGRPGEASGNKDDHKDQDNVETILPDEEYNDQFNKDISETSPAMQELQYEQDPLDGIRDSSTLYVMPILIS